MQAINLYKGNDRFYRDLFMPLVHTVTDAETAHSVAIKLAKHGIVPKLIDDEELKPLLVFVINILIKHYKIYIFHIQKTTVWGLEFNNPIGLAAGFDKDGEAITGLSKLGFGFLEIGSVRTA